MASTIRRVVGLGALLGAVGVAIWGGVTLRKVTGGNGNPLALLDLYNKPQKFFPGKDRVNILLIGKDYDRDKKGMPRTKQFVKGDDGKVTVLNSRSDSILLLSCDLTNRKVAALSIPRDTKVTYRNPVTGKIQTGKINATYMWGGARLLRQQVAELTGITPDYSVAVKPDAVGNMVDLLGGVDVETIDAMEYHDNWAGLHIDLPKGKQRIVGKQAIGFARFREADIYVRNPDGSPIPTSRTTFRKKSRSEIKHSLEEGDGRRMARQQQLIRAMIAEGKKPKNILRAGNLVETARAQLETDLKPDQLIALASIYRKVQTDQIASASLMGEGTRKGVYFFLPDRRKTEALVQWLVYGDERAANSITTVSVKNGTKVAGAARRAATVLQEQGGFDASFSPEAPKKPAVKTQIVYTKAVVFPRARTIAQMLGGGVLVKDTKPDTTGTLDTPQPDITVILGSDIVPTLTERSAQR